MAPATALGEDLAGLGRPKLFRPWNDTRFHAAPPIKEHLGLAIGYEGAGGFYVELSLDGLLVAAGLHNPQSDQVERMRAAIDKPRTAASLAKAVDVAPRLRASSSTSPTSCAARAATRPTIRGSSCCAGAGWSSPSASRSAAG